MPGPKSVAIRLRRVTILVRSVFAGALGVAARLLMRGTRHTGGSIVRGTTLAAAACVVAACTATGAVSGAAQGKITTTPARPASPASAANTASPEGAAGTTGANWPEY